MMLYYAYELQRQLAEPVRLWANAVEQVSSSPYNPFTDTWLGKSMAAGAEIVALLPDHDVHITDWIDAREVPLAQGNFDLDDYIDYVIEFCRYLGPDVHVIAVCQPSVPVMAAAALMAAD